MALLTGGITLTRSGGPTERNKFTVEPPCALCGEADAVALAILTEDLEVLWRTACPNGHTLLLTKKHP